MDDALPPGIDPRLFIVLTDAGIKTLSHLCAQTLAQLAALEGMPDHGVQFISQVLTHVGRGLAPMTLSPQPLVASDEQLRALYTAQFGPSARLRS